LKPDRKDVLYKSSDRKFNCPVMVSPAPAAPSIVHDAKLNPVINKAFHIIYFFEAATTTAYRGSHDLLGARLPSRHLSEYKSKADGLIDMDSSPCNRKL
jgi:hypothetical protein